MSGSELEPGAPQTDGPKDPAQADYEEGQKFLKDMNTAQAANAFHNALVGFEQSENEPGIANASDKLADICMERQEYDKALVHIARAYEICDKLEDLASVISLKKKMASCHKGLKQFDETLKIKLELLDTFADWKNPALSVEMLISIAELYVEMGEKEKAADSYNTAASIHANYGHPRHAQSLKDKAEECLKTE